MEFSIKSGSPEKQRSACVVVGVFEARKLTLPAELLDKAAKGYIADIVRRGDMEGKAGSTLLLHNVPGTLSDRILLIGLGNLFFLANNPTGAVAGVMAMVVGVTFLWLATQAMFSNPKHTEQAPGIQR